MKRQNVLNNQKKVGLYSDETYVAACTAWSIIDETDKSEQGTGYHDPDNMGGYNFQDGPSNYMDNTLIADIYGYVIGVPTILGITGGFNFKK